MNNSAFLYFLKLTKASSVINLPYPLNSAKNIKVTMAKYTTSSAGGDHCMIKINGFNENVFFDDVTVHKCVKVLPLPSDNGSTMVYENQYIDTPDVTVEERKKSSLTCLRIDVLFNLQLSQDISPTNPFYLEVRIW